MPRRRRPLLREPVKALVVTAALIVALPLIWAGGELHRRNCVHEGGVACSLLPWVDGHAKATAAPTYSAAPRGSAGSPDRGSRGCKRSGGYSAAPCTQP